ncbi:hypothetical protein [Oleisolibacter albus]|uniref:hypothetical protein n=1 Tax=Oleisolibacter albus TaxID=2171757 RepID=UPI000DF476DE|nr:hypothetical protein [Oleisolibacter albus]
MLFRHVFLLSLALLSACSSAAPKTAKVDETSAEAAVVLEVDYYLHRLARGVTPTLGRFDVAGSRFDGNPLSATVEMGEPILSGSGKTYAVALVEPGIYALQQLKVKKQWAACYDGGSVAFEVKPGTVTYLGLLDPLPSFDAIIRKTPQELRLGQVGIAFGERAPLKLPTEVGEWQAPLAAFLTANFPNITAVPQPATTVPVTFRPGRTLDMTLKVCHGFYEENE